MSPANSKHSKDSATTTSPSSQDTTTGAVTQDKNATTNDPGWTTSLAPRTSLSYGQAVEEVRISLMDAVKRQAMSDVPYGVLLSGGLDSSVISAIAEKFAGKRIEDGGSTPAWWPRLHSFAVGLKGGSRPGKGTTRGRAYRYRSP